MLPLNIHILIGERYHHPLLQVTAKLICAEHPIISRSFNPCPITVHMEPLPPQSSKFTFEYLLLPPRSATHAISRWLSSCVLQQTYAPSYTSHIHVASIERYRSPVLVPSIFGANQFGRWVVTHSLAGFNFHDHRPAVKMNQHPLWYLMSEQLSTLTQR